MSNLRPARYAAAFQETLPLCDSGGPTLAAVIAVLAVHPQILSGVYWAVGQVSKQHRLLCERCGVSAKVLAMWSTIHAPPRPRHPQALLGLKKKKKDTSLYKESGNGLSAST